MSYPSYKELIEFVFALGFKDCQKAECSKCVLGQKYGTFDGTFCEWHRKLNTQMRGGKK
jgi:hypothetical protein